MSSILVNIDDSLNSGNNYFIKERIFKYVLRGIVYQYVHSTKGSIFGSLKLKSLINEEKNYLKYCTVENIICNFGLSSIEVKDLCRDKDLISNISDGEFVVMTDDDAIIIDIDLDQCISLFTKGAVDIKINDSFIDLNEIKPINLQQSIIKALKSIHVKFTDKFYDDLEKYCIDNFDKVFERETKMNKYFRLF